MTTQPPNSRPRGGTSHLALHRRLPACARRRPIALLARRADDLAGHPFVGPAGKLLDRCLAEAGIDRAWTYITNVVKHFKWVPRGSRRVHNKPGAVVIEALLSVARGRNCGDSAANHRCAGSDGGTGLVWKSVPRHLGSRSTDAVGVGDRYARDSAPLGTFVRSRRGMGRMRNPQIRRGFPQGRAMVT